jgi:hypothetical protein
MVFGERHRVVRGSEIDSGATASIDGDRGAGPGGVAVLAARNGIGVGNR